MIDSIDYALYTLTSLTCDVAEGMLLRVEFEGGFVGYAACQPWEKLGDPSITTLLKALRRKEKSFHPLLKEALVFAYMDAVNRSRGRSILDGLEVPDSHWLLTTPQAKEVEQAAKEGFTVVKVKVKKEKIDALAPLFSAAKALCVKVRLDIQEALTFSEYLEFGRALLPSEEEIDFIEDPFPFDAKKWIEARKKLPFPLACDRQVKKAAQNKESADVLVVKPAIDGCVPFTAGKRVVVTSYLDHPLGQMFAAYSAALMKNEGASIDICGLMSHRYYEQSAFSEQLPNVGPHFLAPKGAGCGFGQLLEEVIWKKVG